ncbi:MAG: hypothetical protein RR416_05060, partial [Clostridia bacterium]
FDIVQWVFSFNANLYMGPKIVYGLVGVAGMWLFVYLLINKFSPKRFCAARPFVEKKNAKEESEKIIETK